MKIEVMIEITVEAAWVSVIAGSVGAVEVNSRVVVILQSLWLVMFYCTI